MVEPISLPGQPDIEYHPNEAKYRERTAKRLRENPNLPSTPLPSPFPRQVSGPIVWEGADWTNEDQWVYRLSPSELDEIHAGMEHFKGAASSLKS